MGQLSAESHSSRALDRFPSRSEGGPVVTHRSLSRSFCTRPPAPARRRCPTFTEARSRAMIKGLLTLVALSSFFVMTCGDALAQKPAGKPILSGPLVKLDI